jgi:ribonucleoside-diphosphate reductase alpha chain
MELTITKRDGTKEPFNADKINRSIERACLGLQDPISMVTQIATETRLTLYDGITTEEMDQATINAAVQNIKEDIEYDKVAVRLLLKTIYRKVVGDYEDNLEILRKKHRDGFAAWVKKGVADGMLDPRMDEKFDLKDLASALDIRRDELFVYAGLSTVLNRYSIKDVKNDPAETPQYLFMRIAMGLSFNEKDPTLWAKRFYNKMSQMKYIAGGSTNLGAGTTRPSLSNCFLLQIEDDMEHIAKSVGDVMMLSKASGGIGANVTKLRATGSPLKSNNTPSSGPTPFAKIIDTAIRAVQRGGKKKGALCFYMENWHIDFPEFLDWKHNAGDDYMRMRTADTAAFISDEFMNRVANRELWYMFDPKETPDLIELYGKEFSARYAEYVEMADKGQLRVFKKVPAEELYRQMLGALQATGHPWLTWKDPMNLRALNNNTGTIHMSNLCTEICLPQDRENIAVCNLASLNLASHVHNKQIDWENLEESIRLAVHQLDNLIDINVLPIAEATHSDQENRAIGLGVMGFSDMLEQIGLSYESEHAHNFADKVFEFVSYVAIDESANLAAERGAYKNFKGSGWSKGMVPIDTIKTLEDGRGMTLTVAKEHRYRGLNWDALREKVKKGMRNATLMATAPNANIGLVAGTTPGIDPRFAQVFSRNKISGKYLDLNHNLVNDLKNMGIWEKVKDRIVAEQGDISTIDDIPQHVRDIYKTSFSTSPYAFIEVAARAQKWMDQSLSRNMYLETRDVSEMMDIYATAWKKGLKSTYYLHMKPRHTAEQSTVRVNKAEQMGKRGFAAVMEAAAEAPAPASEQITVAEAIAVNEPIAETAVAAFGFTAPATSEATLAESHMTSPVEATLVKASSGPFAAIKTELQAEHVHTSSPTQQATPGAATNAPRIMPPSDPQEQFLCDSCQ